VSYKQETEIDAFQGQMPQGWQKYHKTYIYKQQFTDLEYHEIVLTHVSVNKAMAGHVEKININVKGKMCQKLSGTVFMVHTLRMAIKHGKQV
jgi:hypothetical protein